MRCACSTFTAATSIGGIETLLVTMARMRALCPAIEPEVALCFEGRLSAELAATGVPVHHLPEVRASRPQTIRRARRALAALIESGRFDRVICHAAWSQALFGGVVRRANVPLVFWAHDVATGTHWTERLARRVRPDLVICNSRYTADSMSRLYDDVPAIVLTYPIDTTRGRPDGGGARRAAPGVRHAGRRDGPHSGQPHGGVEGPRGRGRGARRNCATSPDGCGGSSAGRNGRKKSAYVDELVAAARRLGIEDRVRWLGERTDVRRLLAAADVHCQANVAPEPFGIAYVEALAAGLPVVASRAGGAIEIVDESCGVLVPPGDSGALAAALERLIVDRPLSREARRRRAGASAAPVRSRDAAGPARRGADGDVAGGSVAPDVVVECADARSASASKPRLEPRRDLPHGRSGALGARHRRRPAGRRRMRQRRAVASAGASLRRLLRPRRGAVPGVSHRRGIPPDRSRCAPTVAAVADRRRRSRRRHRGRNDRTPRESVGVHARARRASPGRAAGWW